MLLLDHPEAMEHRSPDSQADILWISDCRVPMRTVGAANLCFLRAVLWHPGAPRLAPTDTQGSILPGLEMRPTVAGGLGPQDEPIVQ